MKPIRALVSFAFMSFILTVSAAGLPRQAWALASRGTSTATATSSTSLGIHPPISAGADVMIAQIAYSCCSVSVTSPSGWTVITQDQSTSGIAHLLAYHVVVSNINEPTTYTWSFSSAVDAAGGIVDYIGVEKRLAGRRLQ
jgi:hypothetical protein